MLVRFTVENFLSFMDKASLEMEAGSIREYSHNVITKKVGTQDVKLLKSVSIMGANSSGKSNFLKAFSLMRHSVMHSAKDIKFSGLSIEPFLLNTKTEKAPSTFEVIVVIDRICYRYGFQGTDDKIHNEWLFTIIKRKEENLFTRVGQDYNIDKRFQAELKQKLSFLIDYTRENALFLSVLSQFNITFAQSISAWFSKSILSLDNNMDETINYTANELKNPTFRAFIYNIIQKSDLGFSTVEEEIAEKTERYKDKDLLISTLYDEELKNYTIKTKHMKFDGNFKPVSSIYFDLKKSESSGAQKFIGLLGLIGKALIENRLIWIDELDSKLHNDMVNIILNLFNSAKNNPNGAQLIVTTHNNNILKRLRRDQMVFLNKNEFGISSISSLYMSNPTIRSDASFDKDYLLGAYGGVPKINQQLLIEFDPEADIWKPDTSTTK